VPGGKHLAAYSRIERLTIPSNVHQKPVLAARKVNLAHHPKSEPAGENRSKAGSYSPNEGVKIHKWVSL